MGVVFLCTSMHAWRPVFSPCSIQYSQASWYEYHPSTPSLERQGRTRGYSYQRDCNITYKVSRLSCRLIVFVLQDLQRLCVFLPEIYLSISIWYTTEIQTREVALE